MITTTILKPALIKRQLLIVISIFLMLGDWSLFSLTEFKYMLIDFIDDAPKNANIRIYVDKNTSVIIDDFKYQEQLEFVEFDCPQFYSEDGQDHQGVFGYFVKRLPFFDWPSGYTAVWVTDLAYLPSLEMSEKYLDNFLESKNKLILKRGTSEYGSSTAPSRFRNEAMIKITKIPIPIEILNKFLERLLNGYYYTDLEIVYEYYKKKYDVKKENIGLAPFEIHGWLMYEIIKYLQKLNIWYTLQVYVDLEPFFKKLYYTNPDVKRILNTSFQQIKDYKRHMIKKDVDDFPKLLQEFRKISNESCRKLRDLNNPQINETCEFYEKISKKLKDTAVVEYRFTTKNLGKTRRKEK
jgi:hypothetical protein